MSDECTCRQCGQFLLLLDFILESFGGNKLELWKAGGSRPWRAGPGRAVAQVGAGDAGAEDGARVLQLVLQRLELDCKGVGSGTSAVTALAQDSSRGAQNRLTGSPLHVAYASLTDNKFIVGCVVVVDVVCC